jgi:hypothetical protein
MDKAIREFEIGYDAEAEDPKSLTPKQKRLMGELKAAGDSRFSGFMRNRGFKEIKSRIIKLS